MENPLRVSSVKLQNENGDSLEVCDDGEGEMSICTSDGDWFCFPASEAEKVIAVIRDMAQKSLSRVDPVEPEKTEASKDAVVRSTRGRR